MDRYRHVYSGRPPDHCCFGECLRVLPNGDWAVFFTTGGAGEPEKDNYIALCRSGDRGRTWSAPQEVLRLAGRGVMFAEAFTCASEVRLLGFSHLGRFDDWRVFTMTSPDSGRTWTPAAEFAPLPGRAWPQARCVASWGEWLIPFIGYETPGDTSASPMDDGAVSRAFNGVLISGDQGRTWIRSGQTGPTAGWAENTVVELTDGALAMLIRADRTGHLLRSDSADRGRTWSPARPSGIPNPGTRCRLLRLADGRIVLLHNPCPTPGVRNPLAMWVSDDDMKTWPWRRVLSDFPGNLRYPDGFADEQEGFVHLAFDYNRHDVIYWAAELP